MIFCLLVPGHRVRTNIKTYKKIIETLHANGHSLVRDWIMPTYHQGTKATSQHEVDDMLLSVERADAVIADVSSRGTFGIGFAVARALNSRKPTLLLKRRRTPGGLILGSLQSSKRVMSKDFDDQDITSCIKEFIDVCGDIE